MNLLNPFLLTITPQRVFWGALVLISISSLFMKEAKPAGFFMALFFAPACLIGAPIIGWLAVVFSHQQGQLFDQQTYDWGVNAGYSAMDLILFFYIFFFIRTAVGEAMNDRRARRDYLQALSRQERERQLSLTNRLTELNSHSQKLLVGLPTLIRNAEQAIALAEYEYQEGVFASFWDAVEVAVRNLAEFNQHINVIVAYAKEYPIVGRELQTPTPPFQIGVNTFPDATSTAQKLQFIVRQAQKQPDFAKIYEMRRTNQILITGFASLGDALMNLSFTLRESMDDMHQALSGGLSEIAFQQKRTMEETRHATEALANEHARDREQLEKHADEMKGHLAEIRRKFDEGK